MLNELLKEDGGQWVIPIAIAAAAVVLAKGLFGLHRSRSQDRKDFLDLWAKTDKTDDLWLQVAIRHVFGEVIPPALIHRFLNHPQGARALGNLAFAWPLLDVDDATGALRWRRSWHYSKLLRRLEHAASLIAYGILGVAAFVFAGAGALSGKTFAGLCFWILAVESAVFAYRMLMGAERLDSANESVPRWTATLLWERGSPNAKSIVATRRVGKRKLRRSRAESPSAAT
ncbi:hypothetical protein [Lysobacter enzymogenes]|uniref:hypothetical protein n=1 Tax=Lysobacter enzymogenes TaxID=69 RepID=UPI001A956C6F|nr:hypothetical protein [Lysobacter enzymogenes]QQP96730.1 hypothetical protein JHW38_01355 [Lysobacter enzymogenes]